MFMCFVIKLSIGFDVTDEEILFEISRILVIVGFICAFWLNGLFLLEVDECLEKFKAFIIHPILWLASRLELSEVDTESFSQRFPSFVAGFGWKREVVS
jgi:hypothetical protein